MPIHKLDFDLYRPSFLADEDAEDVSDREDSDAPELAVDFDRNEVVVPVVRRETFAFDGRGSGTAQTIVLANGVDATWWRSGRLLVLGHTKNAWLTGGGGRRPDRFRTWWTTSQSPKTHPRRPSSAIGSGPRRRSWRPRRCPSICRAHSQRPSRHSYASRFPLPKGRRLRWLLRLWPCPSTCSAAPPSASAPGKVKAPQRGATCAICNAP